ncbi:DUF397 domain-containing protein [Nocardia sp. CDC159]|uniref:DUF397 domain-containing protein n=1 Tax=Nocardia pulmonis TaxID=2951408 RepID=A0A9X2E3X9_9NOCA|nr:MULTISPECIES: DUF397 domain-containing protein [Nocardia]MCM6773759.1 DUF397 domain-containing protein [Nocardia pulmonis]MCM6786646.1 DUF397 domain-containing protein [Nocardia sp. CDC159]
MTGDKSGARWFQEQSQWWQPNLVAVRDSKNPTGPALTFTPADWNTFIAGAQHGEFDCP